MTILPLDRVKVLSEALPYIQRFYNQVMVVKYGGSAMQNTVLKHDFARDVVLLKAVGMHPVIVHGGGPDIARNLAKVNIESQFVDGLRVTDDATLAVVRQTLTTLNREIVESIVAHGGNAQGVVANPMIVARPFIPEASSEKVELGWVGELTSVSAEFNRLVHSSDSIPVVAPLGISAAGDCYNINADWVASRIAQHLSAEKLILMTNTAGLLDQQGELIVETSKDAVAQMIEQEVIHGGMLPKVSCAFEAISAGVSRAHIIDGRVEHALLLELLTDSGVGTLITSEQQSAACFY